VWTNSRGRGNRPFAGRVYRDVWTTVTSFGKISRVAMCSMGKPHTSSPCVLCKGPTSAPSVSLAKPGSAPAWKKEKGQCCMGKELCGAVCYVLLYSEHSANSRWIRHLELGKSLTRVDLERDDSL
jgi:hypothetical protein